MLKYQGAFFGCQNPSLSVYMPWARLLQWMSLLWRVLPNEWRRTRKRNLHLAFIWVLRICELFPKTRSNWIGFCSSKTWLLFAVRTENYNLFFVTERSGSLNSCQTCFYPITRSQGVESAVWHLRGKKPKTSLSNVSFYLSCSQNGFFFPLFFSKIITAM